DVIGLDGAHLEPGFFTRSDEAVVGEVVVGLVAEATLGDDQTDGSEVGLALRSARGVGRLLFGCRRGVGGLGLGGRCRLGRRGGPRWGGPARREAGGGARAGARGGGGAVRAGAAAAAWGGGGGGGGGAGAAAGRGGGRARGPPPRGRGALPRRLPLGCLWVTS